MSEMGRFLVFMGVILVVVGVILWLAPRIPWLGKLPGDIVWQRGRWTFYFPFWEVKEKGLIATSGQWPVKGKLLA